MQLLTSRISASPYFPRLSLAMTRDASELVEVQRLRERSFLETMGLSVRVPPPAPEQDEYDALCEHLIVRDDYSGEVVGTYRLLGPDAARRIGRLHAEREFDLGPLSALRPVMAEAGRAFVHPDYRGSAVITLLWSGLLAWMARERCQYLAGTASISLADGGGNAAAVYHALRERHLAPVDLQVKPRVPLALPDNPPAREAWVPALIKGYLRGGAWIGGRPAWDPDFHSADLFMLLPLQRMLRRQMRQALREAVQ